MYIQRKKLGLVNSQMLIFFSRLRDFFYAFVLKVVCVAFTTRKGGKVTKAAGAACQ